MNLCWMVPGLLMVQGVVPNDSDDDKIIAAALEICSAPLPPYGLFLFD